MKILRLFFYSLILLIAVTIALGYFILFNSGIFDPPEPKLDTIHVVQAPSSFTPLPPTNAPISPNERPNQATFIDLMAALNAARQSAGASPLTLNPKLNGAAQVQALYNSQIGRLSHEGANGNQVQYRVEVQGYNWYAVGENLLSRWDIDGYEVYEQWKASPKHNVNMMNPVYTEIGLAYMITSNGHVYYAMVLGKPR